MQLNRTRICFKMKDGNYRKTKIPKNKRPTKKDLKKKHGIWDDSYFQIKVGYYFDTRIAKEIREACKDLGLTKVNFVKQAIIYYLQFIYKKKEASD